jgi:hypothetical protein
VVLFREHEPGAGGLQVRPRLGSRLLGVVRGELQGFFAASLLGLGGGQRPLGALDLPR